MESPDKQILPTSGRLLGIDFGSVRIGVAISDADQKIASPLATYTRRNANLDGEYFAKLVNQEVVVGIVVGLPIHMSGDESQKSIEAREFGHWLLETTMTPVTWIDERYTTAQAREMLAESQMSGRKKKSMVDKIAAQAILSAFLESNRRSRQQPSNLNRS